MPTRTKYLLDPEYAHRYQRAFGVPPERPFFELFIPEQFRKKNLLQATQSPIWRLERDVIWPQMANLLQRDRITGDLVEFGVYGGGSFRRLIEIFRPLGVINRYYGFDSFLGLPKSEIERDHPLFWNEGLFADTSKEKVLRYLADGLGTLDQIELVEGWFSKTLPAMRDRISRIAFVRVDCDLYSSTCDVFTFLSDRLVDGAIIYFDDWTHEATTGESCAFFEFAESHANRFRFEHLLTVSDGALAVRVKTKI
jgi:Macrocin-O-methyltransferase (TylF)